MPVATRRPDEPEFHPRISDDVLRAEKTAVREARRQLSALPTSVSMRSANAFAGSSAITAAILGMQKTQLATLTKGNPWRDYVASIDFGSSSVVAKAMETSVSMRSANAFAGSSAITDAILGMQKTQLATLTKGNPWRDYLASIDFGSSSVVAKAMEASVSMRSANAFAGSSAITAAILGMQKTQPFSPAFTLVDGQGAFIIDPDVAVPSAANVLAWRRELSPADRRRFDDHLREVWLYFMALALAIAIAATHPQPLVILGAILGGAWLSHSMICACTTALEIIEGGTDLADDSLPPPREE
jgi:hypothetical protein